MILIFNLELVPWTDHDLITTKELVSKTSHDLILNLYLGMAPRARSWSQNMLCDGPEGRPNSLPQPAWHLAELFFWSDMSWLRADLCPNSYVISTCFSFLSKLPLCTCYISYIGIERIIHNLLFRILRNMLFVELGPTGFPMMAFFGHSPPNDSKVIVNIHDDICHIVPFIVINKIKSIKRDICVFHHQTLHVVIFCEFHNIHQSQFFIKDAPFERC